MKRTYQPSVTKRKRTHGFLVRMRQKGAGQLLEQDGQKDEKSWLFDPGNELKEVKAIVHEDVFKNLKRSKKKVKLHSIL